jgi:glutamate--cysteine ligase
MSNAETLLGKIRRKYKEYGIQEKPFIIVKADAGTYGMGIMTVRDPKDLADLNRRSRNKMSIIKDGQEVSEVILQEGVPTYERVNESVAEPVVYMIDLNQLPKPGSKPGASAPNRFYMYGVIARLAMVAASYELEATDPNAEIYE